MVTILARSRWTSTAARGSAFVWSRIRGIVCHYPAAGRDVGVLSQAQEVERLRGWRNYHVGTLGWSDIGYNYAIFQSGRVYSLRGDRVGAHAVGHNSTTAGVLFVVGDNEALTSAAVNSFKALRNTLRKRGCGTGVWGHTQMSGNSTRCPGPKVMALVKNGSLKGAPTSTGGGGTSAPAPAPKPTPAPKPSGAGKLKLDKRFGTATVKALQRFLNSKGAKLTVDGKAGPKTWRALQSYLGTPVDGKVSKQSYKASELGNGITGGWEHTGRGSSGSTMVRALQKWVGVKSDGVWFEGTTGALQAKLNSLGVGM